MEKVLRSLIHERFPLDLRFKIELLSRRRDIINKEKQEELIKLLREFDIKDIVQLGPGTNRYAFRLDGFVVKVATDHDGKIDNMKEFKMAKRLFPYVTKTYEVSDNGTILVAEYIQPFASFAEMCKYADQIRAILTKLSTVYLIGDVGISPINYSNWGLRIGTDDPVCLDFAYVYDVSSELFLCRHCNSGSMLVPNKDFTELLCPNKGCGHKYLFEDIRTKLGNDIHRHQIGDLGEEGYRISDSHVLTTLDETRSNYLARKKKVVEEKPKEEKEEFIDEFHLDNNKEEDIMSIKKFKFTNGVINATASIEVTSEDVKRAENGLNGTNTEKVEVSFPIATFDVPNKNATVIPEVVAEVAFEGNMTQCEYGNESFGNDNSNEESIVEAPITTQEENIEVPVAKVEVVQENMPNAEASPVDEKVNNEEIGEDKSQPADETSQTYNIQSFTPNFTNNMERAISKLSNKIGNHMHEILLFDEVKNYIRDKKMYPDTFYKGIQNAVFRSLMIFCQFTEATVPNQNAKGSHKEFTPPSNIESLPCTPTLIFISRFWNNKSINCIENSSEIMEAYNNMFSDYAGIQPEWLELLAERLQQKMQITKPGIDEIINVINTLYCVEECENDYEDKGEEEFETSEDQIGSKESVEEKVETQNIETLSNQKDNGVVFGGDINDQLAGDFDYDDNDDEYDEEESNTHTYVELRRNVGGYDIIKLITADDYDTITIPFYTHLDKIDINELPESSADKRNGIWDWLIHFMCDYRFITNEPEKWLEINNTESGVLSLFKFVILQSELEQGGTLMGFTVTDYIIEVDEDGNETQITDYETLAKINTVIVNNCAYGDISHLSRSLECIGLHDENEIKTIINQAQELEDHHEENLPLAEDDKQDEETFEENISFINDGNDGEAAALSVLMGNQEPDRATVYKDPNDQPEKMFQVCRRK